MKKILLFIALINFGLLKGQDLKKINPISELNNITQNQIKILPKEFSNTTIFMINFDNQKNVKLVVENSKGDIVFAKYLEHVKNTSIKIELGDANKGKYKTILFEDNIIIFEDIIFKI